jgi:acetyl esterase/lipase
MLIKYLIIMKIAYFLLLTLMLLGCKTHYSESVDINITEPQMQTYALYEGKIPGSITTENNEKVRDKNHPDTFIMDITQPTITAYLPSPELATGTAVVILPGGGYAGVSIVKEGYQVALRLNQLGIAAFVLKYRMPLSQSMIDKSIGPLQDAQQALFWVRNNSEKWRIDPTKIGIMGFSAGGHLAASAAVHFSQPVNSDLAQQNVRPDFQILIYPVISFAANITHEGSRDNLIGPELNPKQVEYYSNEIQVSDATPPAFIVHAGDDGAVPVENSLVYYQALHKHNISSQMLILPSGGHGFGMRNQYDWFQDLTFWLGNMGLLHQSP